MLTRKNKLSLLSLGTREVETPEDDVEAPKTIGVAPTRTMILRPFLNPIVALIARLLGRPFLKKIGAMMLLTVLGHASYLLAGPLIGRIFSPDQIGIYGLFFTIWSIGSAAVCLMYDTAVPAATSDTDADDLTFASIMIG